MDRRILSMVVISAIAVCLASVMFVMPALTQPIAEQSKTITDIKAGVPMTIEMPDVHGGVEKDDEVGVTNIVMTFNRDLDKADLYGSLYLTKPNDWPVAPGDYVVYTERTLVSPALTTLATVEYNLRVSKESLARENIDKNTLVEYRKAEIAGKWMPQETRIVNEDDKYVYLYSKVVLFPHTHYATGGFHP